MSLPTTRPQRREAELDFIRGIAILMVVDFHSPSAVLFTPFRWLGFSHFGWSGVDLFFVLSGFLVGGLLVKEWKLRSRIDSKRFLARRAFKIWPQYYFFLVAALVTGHRPFRSLIGNFCNIQNYVGGIAHTWTLAVEEHAYLLILAALAFAAYRKAKLELVFRWVAGVCATVTVWQFFLTWRGVNTFSRTDTRIGGILMGLLLAILYHEAPAKFAKLQGYRLPLVGILIATLIYFRFLPQAWWVAPLGNLAADLCGVATLLLLYRKKSSPHSRPYNFVAWIGLHSYGIYLWHVAFVGVALSLAHHLVGRPKTVAEALLPPLLGIAAGVLMTMLVEFPILRLRDHLFPRNIDAATGIPATVEIRADVRGPRESVSL